MTLLQDFEKAFEELKKELKFKVSLNELDEVFFIRDHIQDVNFVSNRVSRQVCRRITDTFWGWYNYLHNLVLPAPNSIIASSEGGLFSDQERARIMQMLSIISELASRSSLIALTKDKKAEAQFIDESIASWKKLEVLLVEIFKKTNESWKKKALTLPKIPKPDTSYG